MSNLGKYQDIVVEAAKVGGVDQLIQRIEANAVSRATPAIVVKTLVVAGAGYCAVVGGYRLYSHKRDVQQVLAEEAKRDLRSTIEAPVESDAFDDGTATDNPGQDPDPS